MAGLYASAGAFFSYYLLVIGTFLFTSATFRLFGTITQSYDQANKLASLVLTLYELMSGYLIPVRPFLSRSFRLSLRFVLLPSHFIEALESLRTADVRHEELDQWVLLFSPFFVCLF